MSQKEMVLEAIQGLPDDASMKQIAYRVNFIAAVQEGMDEINRGNWVTHEEIEREMEKWLTE